MVLARILAVLLLLAPPVPAQDGTAESVRQRLEELLHTGRRAEAAAEAARLAGDPAVESGLRRVGTFVRCQVLQEHFRLTRSHPRLAIETARQAERAWREFLRDAGSGLMDLKARYLLGVFLQDRARWRLELNDVLWATEIDRDLTDSGRELRAVIQAIAPDSPDDELAAIRAWARARACINLYLFARLYSPYDARHRVNLMHALEALERIAEEYPGLPAGNCAYFYYGLAWVLYGAAPEAREARDKAREVFLDLWNSVPWIEQNATFLEEVLWNICRLDLQHGEAGRVVAAAAVLRQRYESLESPPGRHAALVLGEAALAQLAADGVEAAVDALEADARWLARRGSTAGDSALADAAARVAAAAGSQVTPRTHPRFMGMAARGLLRQGDPLQALLWTAPLLREPALAAPLRGAAFAAASQAWEARGFLREALHAHLWGNAAGNDGAPEEVAAALRRTVALRRRIARESGLAADRRALEEAEARVPRPAGEMEFRAGVRAYENGALAEARAWLERVPASSNYHPLALALSTHVRYLTLPEAPAADDELRAILAALEALDALSPRAPNWLAAQALRCLTQALAKRALGDLEGAEEDLAGYEEQFSAQPHLVPEALKLRIGIAARRNRPAAARATLTTLRERFPGHRALGEACLILGRHLRGGADPPAADLRESVALRQEARRILDGEFPSRDCYLLAVDEMALGEAARALTILDELARLDPPVLHGVRDALALRRVRCLIALDRAPDAEPILAEVLQRKPSHLQPLRLRALLLGGTVVKEGQHFCERRHLGRSEEAFEIWERIKRHAELDTPYGPLWYEAQFHVALLNYWAGNSRRVSACYRWIEVSGYPVFHGHALAEHFRWLAERVPPP
ncbi:MAG: hypothetical protein JXQ29_01595 [Planctomycetes bacterium]|nr:hypothetical protein [Planctomycetota bacterium]